MLYHCTYSNFSLVHCFSAEPVPLMHELSSNSRSCALIVSKTVHLVHGPVCTTAHLVCRTCLRITAPAPTYSACPVLSTWCAGTCLSNVHLVFRTCLSHCTHGAGLACSSTHRVCWTCLYNCSPGVHCALCRTCLTNGPPGAGPVCTAALLVCRTCLYSCPPGTGPVWISVHLRPVCTAIHLSVQLSTWCAGPVCTAVHLVQDLSV